MIRTPNLKKLPLAGLGSHSQLDLQVYLYLAVFWLAV